MQTSVITRNEVTLATKSKMGLNNHISDVAGCSSIQTFPAFSWASANLAATSASALPNRTFSFL